MLSIVKVLSIIFMNIKQTCEKSQKLVKIMVSPSHGNILIYYFIASKLKNINKYTNLMEVLYLFEQVLADETKKSLYQAHTFCGKNVSKHKLWEQQMISYLTDVTKQLADTNEQMQVWVDTNMI